MRVNVTYAHTSGDNLMRGLNLNPPIDGGDRLDPSFANVVEVLGDASSTQHTLNVGATHQLQLPRPAAPRRRRPIMIGGGADDHDHERRPPPPPPPGGARTRPTRAGTGGACRCSRTSARPRSSTTPTARSACRPPAASPTTGARRTTTSAAASTSSWSSSQLRNFNANLNFNASSAPPYTIRTGVDTNGDLVFNDRPDGVGRNTAARRGPVDHQRVLQLLAGRSASRCRCPAASTSDRKAARWRRRRAPRRAPAATACRST